MEQASRVLFRSRRTLKKKFVFDCNTVVQRPNNGFKAFVKVCTSWQVSPLSEKASFLARIHVRKNFSSRKVGKVNKRNESELSSFNKCFCNVHRLKPASPVARTYKISNLSHNVSPGLEDGSSYWPRHPGQKKFSRLQEGNLTQTAKSLLRSFQTSNSYQTTSKVSTRLTKLKVLCTPILTSWGWCNTCHLKEKKVRLRGFPGRSSRPKHEAQTNQRLIMKCFSNEQHRIAIAILLIISGTVERNPGPEGEVASSRNRNIRKGHSTVMVTSLNVRGLNEEVKLRHLVNYCYSKSSRDLDGVFLFQETYLTQPNKIPFLWRGNYFLTPGTGNSCGCLTLLSSHINIIGSRELGNRGHVLVCQKTGDQKATYIIANIYAPCPNSQAKLEFFEQVFNVVGDLELEFDCYNTLIGGDFNLNFCIGETKNRNYSSQEDRLAKMVKQLMTTSNLSDIWRDNSEFTWRRPNTDIFSTIDRIMYAKEKFVLDASKCDWAVTFSDHAAVEAEFSLKNVEVTNKSKITRLDPSLLCSKEGKDLIEASFVELFRNACPNWDPHLKLEYAKMCIRTVAEKAQADRKKKEISTEEELGEELNLAMRSLQDQNLREEQIDELIEHIEELRNKKSVLVEEKGRRLAEKLGTKWYNEGEKSTKYFLRLLNRSNPDKFTSINKESGEEVTGQKEIEDTIVDFYKTLYENYEKGHLRDIDISDDFFKNLQPVTGDDEEEVVNQIGLEELGRTLAGCKDSAPGPDGIPYSFYKALWRWVGPLILDAWNYTISTGKLCPSHKVSFLKLLPKPGKDPKKLTNWRPITLSNCDHKLITKTYSNRMSIAVAPKIKERQTAYLKGRLINDNVRALLGSINITNLEDRVDGLLVSLDAKKAFDSVEHSYIEKILSKFGLKKFVPIFKILYSELRSDIIVNGRIVEGYNILRGVKQGDALSCILFIMCMEPLLRNIEENQLIEALSSETLVSTLPKTYAYADDVNVIAKNSPNGLQEIFNEYGRLTEASGLELNADKTELMHLKKRLNNDVTELNFDVNYQGVTYRLVTCEQVKINGIVFQQNYRRMRDANVSNAVKRMDKILKTWSARGLTTLGKILIAKTFAISQIIYMMQSFHLDADNFKMINKVIYKFIWNRHYLAAKAPERIRREYTNTPITHGGLGMLDVSELDKGLKLKAIARLFSSEHPFLKLIRNRIDFSDFFFPKCSQDIDNVSSEGVRLLKIARQDLLDQDSLKQNRKFIAALKNVKLSNLLSQAGKNSIAYFNLRRQRLKKVEDITVEQLNSISRFAEKRLIGPLKEVIRLPGDRDFIRTGEVEISMFIRGKAVDLRKLTSKEIRLSITTPIPICNPKIGLILTPIECISWGNILRKLTSTRHKNVILRVFHGEVYTKAKLNRFGLTDSNECPRCGQPEDLEHKFVTCDYVKRIWDAVFTLTRKLKPLNSPNIGRLEQILDTVNPSKLVLTIHAEVLQRILSMKEDSTYLVLPKTFAKLAIQYVAKKERAHKDELETLLSSN